MFNNTIISDRFYKYLIPMLMTAFAVSMSDFMDSIVVSNLLDSNALAVLSMGGAFNSVTSALYSLFGIGGSICFARCQGMADSRSAKKYYSLAVTCAFISSSVISLVCLSDLNAVCGLLCQEDELRSMFDPYMKVQICAAPFICVIMTWISFLPAAGHPIEAMVFNTGANICNIALDIVFIRSFHMGVQGSAYATLVSMLTWAAGLCIWLTIRKSQLRFSLKDGMSLSAVGDIMTLGFAIALSQLGFSIRIGYSNAILSDLFDKEGIIVFAVCMQLVSIMSIFLSGMLRTVTPLVSMLNGQNDFEGIRQVMKKGMRLLGAVSFAAAVLMILFPEAALTLYNAENISTPDLAVREIRIFASVLGLRCLYMLYMSYVNAIGRKKYSLFISMFDGFIGVLLFARPMVAVFGPMGFWWTYPLVSVVLSACIVVINRIIAAGSDGELEPVFLTKRGQSESMLHTFYAKDEKSSLADAGLAASEFARKNGFSDRVCNIVSLVAEEYPYYIMKHVVHVSLMDSLISCTDREVVLGFRIVGSAYENSWLENNDNEENNRIVEGFVKKIDYSYAMGINYSRIVISEKGSENNEEENSTDS